MNTIYVQLSKNSEYQNFDGYCGVLPNRKAVEEKIQEMYGHYSDDTEINVATVETDDCIYVGVVSNDDTLFNEYREEGDYESAFYECARDAVCFKKEQI